MLETFGKQFSDSVSLSLYVNCESSSLIMVSIWVIFSGHSCGWLSALVVIIKRCSAPLKFFQKTAACDVAISYKACPKSLRDWFLFEPFLKSCRVTSQICPFSSFAVPDELLHSVAALSLHCLQLVMNALLTGTSLTAMNCPLKLCIWSRQLCWLILCQKFSSDPCIATFL